MSSSPPSGPAPPPHTQSQYTQSQYTQSQYTQSQYTQNQYTQKKTAERVRTAIAAGFVVATAQIRSTPVWVRFG
jgi:hypothetical protein